MKTAKPAAKPKPETKTPKRPAWTEYGPAPESTSHVKLKTRYEHYIDGQWAVPASSRYYETINPANGKTLAKTAHGDAKDVDRAVAAARRALPAWSALPGAERGRLLYAVARVIQERARELAIVETLDNGKPIRESRDVDIPLAARHFFYHAGWADKLQEAFPGMSVRPVGVIGQVIPWNFPLLMAAWKLAPALAAGNTVVLKPAETTPLSCLHLAEIFHEVGFPAGVVNIVTGFGDAGAALVNHPGVDKIAFTGSTEVGRIIRKATAGSGKKLSLELGGKSPTIVFDDAPLYEAVEGIMDSIFFNQGQVCCAGSRLLVQETIAARFVKMLKDRMRKIRVGDPLDKNVDMGAVNSKMQLEKIRSYVEIGEKEGATKFQTPVSCPKDGFFFPPTLFTDVETNHRIAQEEIFGPVLAMMTFRTKEEALELANNSAYGLAATVWTKDVAKMVEVSRGLRCGTVWGNGANKFDAAAEFGGYKESGFGREGGVQGLYEYVKIEPLEAADPVIKTVGEPKPQAPAAARIWKTPKMLIAGKQVRTESGRYYRATTADGKTLLANVPLGSRKDIRDAVEAAAKAAPGWAKATPYLRGQILYRIAELLQNRAQELSSVIALQSGVSEADASAEVSTAIDRILYYAGWTDKYVGTVNPVTQTDFNITYPDPIGVVGLVGPEAEGFLGIVSKIAPAVAMGNAVIAVPSYGQVLAPMILIEVLDAADVPSGVINIVTGKAEELAPILAEHRGVHGIDVSGPEELTKKVEELSISNMKRVHVDDGTQSGQGRAWARRYLEFKTVWITAVS